MKSREFGTKIASATKPAARQAEERLRERLTGVEADPQLLAAVSSAQATLGEARGRQTALLAARSSAAPQIPAIMPTVSVSLTKLPLK